MVCLAEMKRMRDLEVEKILNKKKIPMLTVPDGITVADLAKLAQRTEEQVCFIKSKMHDGRRERYHKINLKEKLYRQDLAHIVKQLGYRCKFEVKDVVITKKDKDIHAQAVTTDESLLKPRPPVVTVMGHVDHGKTTILDALRKTSVAAGEAGGITQSIGAFSVPLDTGHTVTFLDTPGHSVFTSMRERGAQVTDIVVLVVAADDGVMEQTIESINMAKMAQTSIVVAINKCDKKDARPDMVIDELEAYGIKCEENGGDIQAVRISALKNIGLDKLVNCISAQADQLDLKCDRTMQAQGVIIESKKEQHHGNMASVVLKQGAIKNGAVLIAGTSIAKVRQMFDSNGSKVDKIEPGQAANIMGWRSLPTAGQLVLGVENEQKAKAALRQRETEMKYLESDHVWEEVKDKRQADKREYEELKKKYSHKIHRKTASFKAAFDKNKKDNEIPSFNILVKADVDGSMEAIMKILESYDCDEQCNLNLVQHGIGNLTLSEFEIAKNTEASIFLFNTDVLQEVKKQENDTVSIIHHKVIYHLVEDIIDKINEILPIIEDVNILGESEVLKVFPVKKNFIAGCVVRQGTLESKQLHRILRDNVVVHSGVLESMQHHNSMITLASDNMEYGLMFNEISPVGIKVGDIIQSYSCEMKKTKINWRPPGF
uniref:translation initiation factor IF-2, mitochondrial-like isoform X2 n=1 Tax=Styela clava TaxID=7725 RepID=UPI00193A67F9|nr:translation initiation factor IF-2, mitochondrial-like isoform X2 [Styela clava]